ncbi:hypothetical protein CPB83DRAFT_797510 [Crepidotus variabilis]|uniref:Uncharacterized protein n=1 Tax=Crepidotus variabilis TaxID=179855 RepID=A0A9P6JLI9_9AGAR|nr:hypothetical protein CPB83DRAFT_797510 [Crepidotus variabilis]
MSADSQFMSIAVALGTPSKSFEEVRVEDYLRFYQTTGGHPPPVPQEPTDEFQRKTLNLPPLFKPQTNLVPPTTSSTANPVVSATDGSGLGSTSTVATLFSKPKITNPTDIPLGQEFKMHIIASERYQCIVCMPEYEGFSTEELRYYAYMRGNINSPIPITMDPFVPLNKDSPAPTPVSNADGVSDENLQSQCALPDFARHSPEELRVAYLLYGREMTSAELLGPAAPTITPAATPVAPVPTRPSLFGTPTISQPVPPPIIATSGPAISTPKFSFGFR